MKIFRIVLLVANFALFVYSCLIYNMAYDLRNKTNIPHGKSIMSMGTQSDSINTDASITVTTSEKDYNIIVKRKMVMKMPPSFDCLERYIPDEGFYQFNIRYAVEGYEINITKDGEDVKKFWCAKDELKDYLKKIRYQYQ